VLLSVLTTHLFEKLQKHCERGNGLSQGMGGEHAQYLVQVDVLYHIIGSEEIKK
jgi:hypothetical protein